MPRSRRGLFADLVRSREGLVNRDHPLNKGLLSWWICLPGLIGGDRWVDLARGYHGTFFNIAQSPTSGWGGTQRRGGFGECRFDGSDDSVLVGTFDSFSATGELTVSAWCKSSNTSADTYIIASWGANGCWGLGQTGGVFQDAGGSQVARSVASAPTNNVYNHIAAVIDANNGTIDYYVNGELSNGSLTGSASGGFRTAQEIRIGKLGSVSYGFFNGSIDSVAVRTRRFSATEMRALYREESTGCPTTLRRRFRTPAALLFAWWKLHQRNTPARYL